MSDERRNQKLNRQDAKAAKKDKTIIEPPRWKVTMNTLLKHGMLLLTLLFCWGGAIDRASAQQEMLMGGFDPNAWTIGHQAKSQSQIVVEFVHPNEKIDNWTELLTMQVLRKPKSPEPIEELVKRMHQASSKQCPAMTWNVINRQFSSETEEAGMLYEWSIKGCPPDADQHEIARVVYGRFNVFRLAYVAKTSALSPEKRELWIKELSASKIIRQ